MTRGEFGPPGVLDRVAVTKPAGGFEGIPGGKVTRLGHTNIATTRIYDHRKTRPEDSPTFKVAY
jgi:hypothetical protein